MRRRTRGFQGASAPTQRRQGSPPSTRAPTRDRGLGGSPAQYRVQNARDAVGVRVRGQDASERVVDQLGPVAVIAKAPDNVIDVRIVLLDADVIAVGTQNGVVIALQQDLASLGADRLEMARGDRFARQRVQVRRQESIEDIAESGPRVLADVCNDLPPGRVVALEVVGPRLGPDRALASVQEGSPLRRGVALVLDIADQAHRPSTLREVSKQLGSLLVSKGKWVPIEGATEADVDRPFAAGLMENYRCQCRRRWQDTGGYAIGIEPSGGLDGKLAGNELGPDVSSEADLLRHAVVLVAEEDDEWAASALKTRACAAHRSEVVARGRVQHDDEFVLTNPAQCSREVDQVADVAHVNRQSRR